MADFALARIGTASVIDKNATLATTVRAAGDYDNDTDKAAFVDALLIVQYDGGPPTAGAVVAELCVLYGDGAASELFPNGGDGTVGANVAAQKSTLVGVFETRSPSTSVDERLIINDIPVRVGGTNRFVLTNTSGQTFDLTWQLNITKYKYTVV
jgi:hypothetical protein